MTAVVGGHGHGEEAEDPLDNPLAVYWTKVCGSWVAEELRASRGFHSGFHHGTIAGLVNAGSCSRTNGAGLFGNGPGRAGHEEMQTIEHYVDHNNLSDDARGFKRPKYDGVHTFDKLTDVFHSGTKHEENQPNHLHVDTQHCITRLRHRVRQPVHALFLPGAGLQHRRGREIARRARACRSTSPTLRPLQDVRQSWTRTR